MPMAKVVVTGRDEEDGKRIVKDMTDKGQDALFVHADVTKKSRDWSGSW